MNKVFNKTHAYYIILTLFGVLFFLMNYLTPMSGDDYAYCFYYDDHSVLLRPTPERVTNFAMAVESMWNHYHIVNGRFITHLVFQVVDALCGKGFFNLINTLMFVWMLHLLVLINNRRNSVLSLALSFLCALCVLPHPGQTMFWMAGGVNYLWTGTVSLAYLYWLQKSGTQKGSWIAYITLFVLGIFAGWSNESISLPIVFGLFLYYIFNRRDFRGKSIPAFVGYGLGAILIVFAPGTFSRLNAEQDVVMAPMGIDQFLFTHTYALLQNYIFCVLPFVVLLIYCYKLFKSLRRHDYSFIHNRYVHLFFAFTLALFTLGMFDSVRVFFGVTLLCIVILLGWIYPYVVKYENSNSITTILLMLCLVPSFYALTAAQRFNEADAYYKDIVLSSPSECVISEPEPLPSSRYSYYGGMETLSPDRYNYHNRVKAFYYGKNYIQALPKDIFEAWQHDMIDSLANYHVIPVTNDQMVPHRIAAIYHYSPCNEHLAFHQRLIRYLLNSEEMLEQKKDVYYVTREGRNWLLVPKDDRAIYVEAPILEGGKEILFAISD